MGSERVYTEVSDLTRNLEVAGRGVPFPSVRLFDSALITVPPLPFTVLCLRPHLTFSTGCAAQSLRIAAELLRWEMEVTP